METLHQEPAKPVEPMPTVTLVIPITLQPALYAQQTGSSSLPPVCALRIVQSPSLLTLQLEYVSHAGRTVRPALQIQFVLSA